MLHKNRMRVAIALLVIGAGFFWGLEVRAAEVASPAAQTALLKKDYARPDGIPFPASNPFSEAKKQLGKTLFFDPRISRSGVMSCATCHNPSLEWGDGQAKGVGDKHEILGRKDPTLLNLAWDKLLFWDGRAQGLEQQALEPIKAEKEMNTPLDELVVQLKSITEYKPLFAKAFPGDKDPITADNVAKAIATFERTIVSAQAPFDTWIEGEESAISEPAKRGFLLFNKKANCAACHSGWNFSDGSFHDIGINDDDIGRGKWLPLPTMQHAFKTVGLRNIDRRAPYMHNGSMKTLMEVVDHYNHGFVKRESLSDEIKELHLTPDEKQDLIEFLKTLTATEPPVTLPDLPR